MSKSSSPARLNSERAFTDIQGMSECLQISPATARRMIASGQIPAYRVGTGTRGIIRIRVSDIEALLRPVTSMSGVV
ncbi:MAG: helix-turn-helix domain-containing protein [Propionibacteriaceae bacterium]